MMYLRIESHRSLQLKIVDGHEWAISDDNLSSFVRVLIASVFFPFDLILEINSPGFCDSYVFYIFINISTSTFSHLMLQQFPSLNIILTWFNSLHIRCRKEVQKCVTMTLVFFFYKMLNFSASLTIVLVEYLSLSLNTSGTAWALFSSPERHCTDVVFESSSAVKWSALCSSSSTAASRHRPLQMFRRWHSCRSSLMVVYLTPQSVPNQNHNS